MAKPRVSLGGGPGIKELEALFRAREMAAEPDVPGAGSPAGVFVLFAPGARGPVVLLTRRSQHVAYHKGEVSFPGGAREPGDDGLLATALRETVEELGVGAEEIEPWGGLSPVATSTGFAVMPFTGRLPAKARLSPCPLEVDEVFEVPVSALLDAACVRDISVLEGDELRRRPAYAHEGRVVWGATAMILTEVLETIRDGVRPEGA